jgi:hypothetical protein
VFAGGRDGRPPPATQIWPKGPHCLSKQSRKPLGVAGRHFPVAQGAVAAKQTEQAFATGPLRTGKRPPLRPALCFRCPSASTSRFSRKGRFRWVHAKQIWCFVARPGSPTVVSGAHPETRPGGIKSSQERGSQCPAGISGAPRLPCSRHASTLSLTVFYDAPLAMF